MSTHTSTGAAGDGLVVRHEVAARRFEALVEGQVSMVEYLEDGATVIFTHTFVPPELRGRGVAEEMVRVALTWAKDAGRRVVPACSYVAKFIARHPEFRSAAG